MSACSASWFVLWLLLRQVVLELRVVMDFEPVIPLVKHVLGDVMRCNPEEHPILVTEPAWNTPANRERMAEIVFEEFGAPAFYIANTGVLNAYVSFIPCAHHIQMFMFPVTRFLWHSFAAGRGSALVIDIGSTTASVTPVIDGFVLRKGTPPPHVISVNS